MEGPVTQAREPTAGRGRLRAALAWTSLVLGTLAAPGLFFWGIGLVLALVGVPLGLLSMAWPPPSERLRRSRTVVVLVVLMLAGLSFVVVYGVVARAAIEITAFFGSLIPLLLIVGFLPDGRRAAALLGVTLGDATWMLFVVYAFEDEGLGQVVLWLVGVAVAAVQALAIVLAMRGRSTFAGAAHA